MPKGKRRRPINVADEVVYAVCEKFVAGTRVSQIVEEIADELGEELTREKVYPLIALACERRYVRVCAPEDRFLSQRMMDRFHSDRFAGYRGDGRRGHDRVVQVVKAGRPTRLEHVAEKAAHLALDVIKKIGECKEVVHVGLGAGWTTMTVARHLAIDMRNDDKVPRLVLHAVSAGFSVDAPSTAPVSFFSFFHDFPQVSYKGLFSTAYVETDAYTETCKLPGVTESFAARDDIDVVITALASAEDEHGELMKFMSDDAERGKEARKHLAKRGWIGDVQYRPYSAHGPIDDDPEIRAMTLFELAHLVELARAESKAVILVCGPCKGCGQLRSEALRPLLKEPSLFVWSHLVVDDATARHCLQAAG